MRYNGLADGLGKEFEGKCKRLSEAWSFRNGTTLYEDKHDLTSTEVNKVLKFLKKPENVGGTYRVTAVLRSK